MGDCVQGTSTSLDPQGGSSPKLLERVRAAVRMKHYSRRTEQAYVRWIRRFIVFHNKKHPSTMGASEIGAFLSWLAVQRRVSASTQNQAQSAGLFLYRDVLEMEGAIGQVPRARVPSRLPVVLSRDEVGRLMEHVDGKIWIIVALLYGAGLRIEECLQLRMKDLRPASDRLRGRAGPGGGWAGCGRRSARDTPSRGGG